MSDGPLIVQSDKTLLLDIDHILSDECRRAIAAFAELEKSPEHIHTYRLTPLGLWNISLILVVPRRENIYIVFLVSVKKVLGFSIIS